MLFFDLEPYTKEGKKRILTPFGPSFVDGNGNRFIGICGVPITSFQETLTKMLLWHCMDGTGLFLVDIDEAWAIDLNQFCRSLQTKNINYPLAMDGTVDPLQFPLLNVAKIRRYLFLGDIRWIQSTYKGKVSANYLLKGLSIRFDDVAVGSFQTMIEQFPIEQFSNLYEHLKKTTVVSKSFSVEKEIRWAMYKYTILPTIVYVICSKVKKGTVLDGNTLEFCIPHLSWFLQWEEEFLQWIHHGQDKEGYLNVFYRIKETFVCNTEVREFLFDRRIHKKKIRWYTKCPCGSKKLFKDCCGQTMSRMENFSNDVNS